MSIPISEKTVIVTGASTGVGAGLAVHLAKIGYKKIAIVARSKDKLEKVAEKCRENGAADVLVLSKDLSVAEASQQTIEETVAHFGGLHILVCNAGAGEKPSTVRETSLETWNWTLNLNLTACFLLTKYALPHLEKTKGNIVYTSSVAGMPKVICII